MLILDGNNLGERHRDLNSRVREASDNKLDFNELQEEKCDVDKLFKMELASKYKNIHYILEVLKSGDIFHITRALSYQWIYDDEYAAYINPHYLKEHIFPHMSRKMERKLLTTASMYVRNGDRAKDFYLHCKDAKMRDYAYKFLVFTSDDYKLELMSSNQNFQFLRNSKYLKQFIGDSFAFAEAYMRLQNYNRYILNDLRYMYTVSDEGYLDILEKYDHFDAKCPNRLIRLGLRTSRDIMKKHKSRVLKKPVLYINKLYINVLIRYLTTDDVKLIAPLLLPSSSEYFWSVDFYRTYKFIIDKIPNKELYTFIKNLFNTAYPNEPFEMCKKFYTHKYYDELMTVDEREEWALRHIERDDESWGIENYTWYRFVRFSKAFSPLKRQIYLTPDKGKRSKIVNILPETARNQDDLIETLSYYYERHANESEEHIVSFIEKVIEYHDIYSCNSDCWTALDRLFYTIEVYTTETVARRSIYDWDFCNVAHEKHRYKIISMFYHIIHSNEVPETLEKIVDYLNNCFILDSVIKPLTIERKTLLSQFFINHYVEKLKLLVEELDKNTENEDSTRLIREKISNEVDKVWNIINLFGRDRSECPEIVLQYTERYESEINESGKEYFSTEQNFVRWLKKDIQSAVEGISYIWYNTCRWDFRLCRLFKKLKVYFPNDVGMEYLEYFKEYLNDIPKSHREYRNVKMAVVGILYLADEEYKINFIEKYVPESPKIDRMNIDNCLLQVQKAICRLAYHSRPPLPLSCILKYIKGDYVHFCLPVFNNYFANSTCIKNFIEAVLNAPLAVQKHGLRLAFKTYTAESLEPLIIDTWKKTKNVSLRKLLFEMLFNRIISGNIEGQRKLYEVLKFYTSDLNHDDDGDVYSLLVSDLFPNEFKGDFIETAWLSVNKLSNKSDDLYRKVRVIRHMEKYIHLVQREFIRIQIINDRLYDLENIKTQYYKNNLQEIIDAKCSLSAKYIVTFNNEEEQKHSLELMNTIMIKCISLWNYEDDSTFIRNFIKMITTKEEANIERCAGMITVYQCILDNVQNVLRKDQIYLLTWELQLVIMGRKTIHDINKTEVNNLSSEKICSVFGQEVGKNIVTLVENGEFYRCFYEQMAEIIKHVGENLCRIISANSCGSYYYISDSLTDIKMTETHVIALCMLPKEAPYNWAEKHEGSIKKIKEFDCKEVHSFLYQLDLQI